jgi:hypothetical protein
MPAPQAAWLAPNKNRPPQQRDCFLPTDRASSRKPGVPRPAYDTHRADPAVVRRD